MEYPTKRDLDGVYFRVKRGDKMVTLCVSDMTTEELTECCNIQDLANISYMEKVGEEYTKLGKSEKSIRDVSLKFGISRTKVRKILVTLGIIQNETTEKLMSLKVKGMNLVDIAKELNMSVATVSTYLPYERVMYNGEISSKNAQNIKNSRMRKKELAN